MGMDLTTGGGSAIFSMGAMPLTMGSREIAELCEKQHKHVLRDIETMLADIVGPKSGAMGTEPNFGPSDFLSSYTDSTGRSLKEYRLPKDLTITLITGYRADLRYRVIKRLEEIEGQQGRHQIPQTLSEALRLAADQQEKIQALQPKADALDRLDCAEGSHVPRLAAKALNVYERKFTRWLEANQWAFRQNGRGPLQGYKDKRDAGYLQHKLGHYVDQHTGEDKTSVQLVITPKGMAKLAQILPKDMQI